MFTFTPANEGLSIRLPYLCPLARFRPRPADHPTTPSPSHTCNALGSMPLQVCVHEPLTECAYARHVGWIDNAWPEVCPGYGVCTRAWRRVDARATT